MHVIEMTKILLKFPRYLHFIVLEKVTSVGGIRHTLAWLSVSLQVVLVTGLFAFFSDLWVMLRVKWDWQWFILSVPMHRLCTDSFHNALLVIVNCIVCMPTIMRTNFQTNQKGLGYWCLSFSFLYRWLKLEKTPLGFELALCNFAKNLMLIGF